MDILAHSLWAGVGVAMLRRHLSVAPRIAAATVGLAALPDVLQMLPVLAWWWFGAGTFAEVRSFAIAISAKSCPVLFKRHLVVDHCAREFGGTVNCAIVGGSWPWVSDRSNDPARCERSHADRNSDAEVWPALVDESQRRGALRISGDLIERWCGGFDALCL